MVYICKHCGEMVVDTNNGDSIHLRDWEEELWGHIQMEHEDVFDDVQDWETPDMLDECYEEESDMSKERVIAILVDYIDNDLAAAEPGYVREVLRDVCGCTDEELKELGVYDWLGFDYEEDAE